MIDKEGAVLFKPKLLIVDDEETILKQLTWALRDVYEIETARDPGEASEKTASFAPDMMILDLSLTSGSGEFEGFKVLRSALEIEPLIKVVVVTGHDHRENALKAIEEGAHDFYTKPVDVEELRVILGRAAHVLSLERELIETRGKQGRELEFEGIIAVSKTMREVFETIRKVSPMDVAVLITGESGTGKELAARAIHSKSMRSSNPFIPINCGAIPETLLESELFGHEKGSFTGAHAMKKGKFEAAEGGSLFLDEIGELPPPLQVKLLRFLQDQIIERVGGSEQIQLNVRVIAATNKDLEEMIKRGSFREDLFYRINTININLPPLRERGDDILLLAKYFLSSYSRKFKKSILGFSDSARELLYRYEWPGNVRELENKIMRSVIMSSGKSILPEDLALEAPEGENGAEEKVGDAGLSGLSGARKVITIKEARREVETRVMTIALIRTSGNVSAAAELLEVSRPTLHDLMKKYGIDPEDFRQNG